MSEAILLTIIITFWFLSFISYLMLDNFYNYLLERYFLGEISDPKINKLQTGKYISICIFIITMVSAIIIMFN